MRSPSPFGLPTIPRLDRLIDPTMRGERRGSGGNMDVVGTIAVVVSVLVLAYQGRELAGHTRIANEVAATQAHRDLLFHWKWVIDVFVRHPDLHALYFGGI